MPPAKYQVGYTRPSASTPTSRRVIACLRCRRRKVRCDGSLPACANCSKVGVECLQGFSSSNISRNRLHYLEGRVRELESQNENSCSVSDSDPIPVTSNGAFNRENEPIGFSAHPPAISFHSENESGSVPADVPPPAREVEKTAPMHHHVMQEDSPMTQSSNVSAPTSITRDQPLAHEVGLLSLANSSDPKYLGPSSGVPFARLIYESAPQSQGLSLNLNQNFCPAGSEKANRTSTQPASLPSPAECQQYAEAYFEVAMFLPFMAHEEVFTLLEDVQNYNETGLWNQALPVTLAFAQIFLLLSLGARLLETKLKADFNSNGLLAAGMRYGSQIQLHDSTEGVQALLLMTLNSFYNPEGLNAWYLLHTIIASCLDLGLQRSNNDHRDLETSEQRKRRYKRSAIFWSAYSLDRVLTTILGRPLTLRDEAIDVEFPGVNKGNEVDLGALEWNHDGVNATFSCSQAFVPCIYALRFDRIVAEIKLMIYRVSRVPHRFPWPSDLASWQRDVESSCRALIQEVESRQRGRRSKSSPPLSLMVVQKLQVKYHSCIMLLYRPSPQISRPTQDAARTCFDSAMEIIRISADLHRFTSMDYTWLSAHSIFVAAITILYSLWTKPAVTVASHTELCFERVNTAEQLLEYLGKTWSVAHSAREKLSHLIRVAVEGYDTLHGTAEIRNSSQQPPDIVDRGGECYDSNAVNDWSQQGVNALVDELGMMREFFDLDWLDNVAVSQWN